MAIRLPQSPLSQHYMQNPHVFGETEDVSAFFRMSCEYQTGNTFFNFLVLRNSADTGVDSGGSRVVFYLRNINATAKEMRLFSTASSTLPRAQWNELELNGAIPDVGFFNVMVTSLGGSTLYTDIRLYINGVDMGTSGASSSNGGGVFGPSQNGGGRVSMGVNAASTNYANNGVMGERALWKEVLTPAECIAITGDRLNPKDRSHNLVSFVKFEGGHPAHDEIAGVTEANLLSRTPCSRGERVADEFFTFEGGLPVAIMPWQYPVTGSIIPQIMHHRRMMRR